MVTKKDIILLSVLRDQKNSVGLDNLYTSDWN